MELGIFKVFAEGAPKKPGKKSTTALPVKKPSMVIFGMKRLL
jgi:hypothetical protein